MNTTHAKILIALRDGGSLLHDICLAMGSLFVAGTLACKVRRTTLDELTHTWGYLEKTRGFNSVDRYTLTEGGMDVARSLRRRAP